MWTAKTRGRIAAIEKKTKRYPTDLTDAEWERIRPLLPRPAKRGRKPSVDLREILNAIRYMTRTGGGWRMLPKDFPPWRTVYWWFRRFVRLLLFRTIHDIALMVDRERAGREPSPPAGIADSQTVKAPAAKTRGYDAGEKIVGRKRHIVVDTDGRLLMVNLTTADISDSAGAQMILDAIRKRWPWVKHLFADGAYDRPSSWTRQPSSTSSLRLSAVSTENPASSSTPPLGGRANLRLVHTLAPSRARLRATPRCLRGHDPCRHE